jgi:hypothetical protein
MNTITSLPTAILHFAYTGVLGPHLRTPIDHQPVVVSSRSERVFLSPRAH